MSDIWFTCHKCGTSYDDNLEIILPEKDIIAWAYSVTHDENYMDAIKKLWIREEYENKKCKSKGKKSTKFSKG